MRFPYLHWSLYFLLITAGITALGAGLGVLAFMLFGMVTGAAFSMTELARNGAKIIGFYAMIWAPGIAIVLCVKRAYERKRLLSKR